MNRRQQRSRGRAKVSTTVSAETLGFLRDKVAAGEATSISEAIDLVVLRVRRLENRRRLSEATAAYFARMKEDQLAAENTAGSAMASASAGVDFDQEL